jgi:hypothetical protein
MYSVDDYHVNFESLFEQSLRSSVGATVCYRIFWASPASLFRVLIFNNVVCWHLDSRPILFWSRFAGHLSCQPLWCVSGLTRHKLWQANAVPTCFEEVISSAIQVLILELPRRPVMKISFL